MSSTRNAAATAALPSWPELPAHELDADMDDFSVCGGDCDDSMPGVNPAAAETCNGIDDDCNNLVDDVGDGIDTDEDAVPDACDNRNATALRKKCSQPPLDFVMLRRAKRKGAVFLTASGCET